MLYVKNSIQQKHMFTIQIKGKKTQLQVGKFGGFWKGKGPRYKLGVEK